MTTISDENQSSFFSVELRVPTNQRHKFILLVSFMHYFKSASLKIIFYSWNYCASKYEAMKKYCERGLYFSINDFRNFLSIHNKFEVMKLEVENIPETSPFPNQSFALRDQTYEAL